MFQDDYPRAPVRVFLRISSGVLCCVLLATALLWTSVAQAQAEPDAGAGSAPTFTQDSDAGFTPADAEQPVPPVEPIAPAPPTAPAPPVAVAPTLVPPAYVAPAYVGPQRSGVVAPPAAPLTAARSRGPSKARIADAHLDRLVIQPTAMTHPEGTFYMSSTDIVFLQLGYAFTDSTQITLTGTPPLGEDAIYPLDLTLKTNLHAEGPVRVAALGSLTGLFGFEEGGFVVGRAGAVTQLCFDRACESSANVAMTVLLAGPALMAVPGAGFIWRVAPWGAILFEADTLMPIGSEAGEYHGAAVSAGFRFPYRTWALDLTLLRPLGAEDPPPVVPLLTFTYRFLP